MDYFIQQFLTSLGYGSTLAVLAAGYTMTFGIIGLVNFAHGEVLMVGAFAAYFVIQIAMLPFWAGVLAAVAGSVIIALLIERVAFKPVRGVGMITLFITSLGASTVIKNLTVLVFNDRLKPFPSPKFLEGSYQIGNIFIYKKIAFIVLITILICILLVLLVKKTKIGIAMRSISYNINIAQTLGINTEMVIIIVFMISATLAGISGIFWGILFGSVQASMGAIPVVYAFIASILGGVGNVLGAIIGGYIIAVGSSLLVAYLPVDLVGLKPLFAWVIFFSILIIKPSGLFKANIK